MEFFKIHYKGILIVVGIIIIIAAAASYGKSAYWQVSGLLQSFSEREVQRIEQQYQTQIQELKEQEQTLRKSLLASQKREKALKDKNDRLQQELQAVKRPVSLNETKERLRKLGYEVR